jgi:Carboxypeptidase regulatory-like domain/TonB dependent receptor/TonB-dependent Receptor Plug Domain
MLRRCPGLLTAWLLVLISTSALAQGGRSEINGTVFDSAKAVMPGVTITVLDERTGLERTAVSGEEGRFLIPTLVPSTYTIKAELPGFQSTTQTGLVLNVGQELTVNLTLQVAGVQEALTVTGQAPLVEPTSSRIGANITNAEIDALPAAGRNQLSLMQIVPGLTPSLNPGSFEGGQYNANGQTTTANLFLVDGAYDNDDRRGGSQGTQARVTLDTMSEFQVLTHQYSAEYGGSSGVVVNAVTKSGSNRTSGRIFEYFQDDSLNATDYFLKQRGEKNPASGSNVFGGSAGGPIVRNKAFWFANFEETRIREAANLEFPANAAPLAVSYSDTTRFTGPNTFLRGDVQLNNNHHLSFRWVREAVLTLNDELEGNASTPSNATYENDAGDHVYSFSWTSVLGSNVTNEIKVGHVRESLLQGPRVFFDDDWNFIGLGNREQFDIGSMNSHPDYNTGNRNNYNSDLIRSLTIDDAFTYFKSGWGGDHTFKIGVAWGQFGAFPQGIGANLIGLYSFPTNTAFNPSLATTYPWRFQIRLGQIDFDQDDWKVFTYLQDKWQLNRKLTLQLGLRYDRQDLTPTVTDAFAPRLGLAYDPKGDGKTLIRGGVGKFYNLQPIAIEATLLSQAVIGPAYVYDTGQITSPAQSGTIPSNVCLQPGGDDGLALIGPDCQAFLTNERARVNAGGYVNDQPTLDGPDRRLPYLWSYSFGVKRELISNLAVSVDYVGNRGKDQLGTIDINEGPVGPNGRTVTRLGPDVFDPTGELIPPSARSTAFRRVLQYQSRADLDTDYDSMEVALEKRMSSRWSGRISYTLARARDVGALTDDLNPRGDYGRTNFDNRHAFAMAANADVWRGFGAGMVFRYYSGYPINETIGSDYNGDNDNNDRPITGVHDLARPILSPLDSTGRAIRNGIDGEKQVLLDGRFQYVWRIQARYQAGLFLELYNLTNQVNFGNATGNRNSSNFMIPVTAGDMRTTQIGFRFTF